MRTTYITATLLLAIFTATAEAGNRRSLCNSRNVQVLVIDNGFNHRMDYRYYVGQSRQNDVVAELAALKLLRTEYQIERALLRAGDTSGVLSLLQAPVQKQSESRAQAGDSRPQAIINRSCLKCHDGSKEGRMNLADISSLDALQGLAVYVKIHTGDMPKNHPALSNAETEIFNTWNVKRNE